MKKLIPQKVKNIYHLLQAILANFLYGFPSKSIKVVGVTGTNGKTTTVLMIAEILEEAGKKVAMASTINFKIGKKQWVNKTKFTTLSSFQVQKFIIDAVKAKCEYLILETSSHSLDQYRVWGVEYDIAVITNITREHLDYHGTMENYRKDKLKLFQNIKMAVVNLDMENPGDFLEEDGYKKITYSTKKIKADMVAENIKLNISHSIFKAKGIEIKLNLPGEFNIENALAAICVGVSENIDMKTMKNGLEKIKVIPGRMESILNRRDLNIIVDYAVTPDSLEKLYTLISKNRKTGNKIISVFGSCGERDRGKRPIMGEIVSRIADFIILTNEDPYDEDPQQIVNEVCSGVNNKKEGEFLWKILDRRDAIKKALQLAKPGDTVVVTGKGAEETMAVGRERIPWNDKKVIQEVLQEIQSK